jgi:hypothetical protein
MESPICAWSIQVTALVSLCQVSYSSIELRIVKDMDCDGLKKNLITDTDGTLFGSSSSVFSQAESLWGTVQTFAFTQCIAP